MQRERRQCDVSGRGRAAPSKVRVIASPRGRAWVRDRSPVYASYDALMPMSRPKIPAAMQRAVRVEAGHRCAIPTCRQTSGLQIHHIHDWAKTRDHSFENLILLCAVCHDRVTKSEIDRKAVRAYKANLSLINGRYGDLERRVLDRFAKDASLSETIVDRANELSLQYLLDDGIIEYLGSADGAFIFPIGGADLNDDDASHHGPARWGLTHVGRDFVERYRSARTIS